MGLTHVRSTLGFVTLPGVAEHKLCVALIHKFVHTQHETLLLCKTNPFRTVGAWASSMCVKTMSVCLQVAVVTGGKVPAYAETHFAVRK